MSFDVAADSYGRFMGRFSEPLSREFVRFADVRAGQRVLDVGCGPGALTARLVDIVGAGGVTAIDPSAPFVAAAEERFPDVDVRLGNAEALPYAEDAFDAALAQLVVHFMSDPVAGLTEMGRVVRPGGTVAACVWDHAGGLSPLSLFWTAVLDLDPGAPHESGLAGAREGHLEELATTAGLHDIESTLLTVNVAFATVADWWEPYLLGVGPAGVYVGGLDADARERLLQRCTDLLPEPPFTVGASAWAIRATA